MIQSENPAKYGLTKDISFKNWLKGNGIEMYSIRNEVKYVIAERFIRTPNTKIYKYMT